MAAVRGREEGANAMSPKQQAADAMAAGKDAVASVVETSTQAMTKAVAQTEVVVKEQIDTAIKNANGVFKAVEDVVEFGKGNVEAAIKANQILVAGLQDLSKTVAANTQGLIEEGMANARALASVKSVKEAMDLQSAFLRSAMEKTMANAMATQQHGLKLAESAFAPVADRAKLAIEKFAKPLAA
jgi:phasin family protein